ncbi:nitrogen fixation protein NifB [Fontibacillus phaseoli]|uniref:FeMo cofactor biosynthesis protein NifB n=1 Tax=Fontibacillus phaseoli TaxID=1416533 RepID=A0A369BLX6_9BACL|nr:nitrogenase cofactor biosynthesis protein NifB [Fontibacillus phaseoli]RCX21596.1 nitrogen fixation protein NifB [Fontibacillus phaseoli]
MESGRCSGPALLEEINRHPCYNEEAHRYFARMHLPVAPACNIQCRYCNRKFDCVNESRPGVVSEVLTPDQADKKVRGVAAQLMQLSVVGIAGPGDPLANPDRTFETFRKVRSGVPDVNLCLSTNGLTLLEHLDVIEELGIRHVTITINAIDPEIGSRIYAWVYDNGVRYEGKEAAELLISRQLAGLKALSERGVLCKVNSVLIPGVNDVHLPEVSKTVKSLGAALHNVTPLIVAPGSPYEQEGQRAPRPKELHALQEICGQEGMKIMRHCRQCRADAIGLLGQDRSADFTWESIEQAPPLNLEAREQLQASLDEKIRQRQQRRRGPDPEIIASDSSEAARFITRVAVATRGSGKVNLHFGHAQEFMIYESDGFTVKLLGVRKIQSYCHGRAECNGDKEATLREICSILGDCQILLCSGIGDHPRKQLQRAGIVPIVRKGDAENLILESSRYSHYFQNHFNSKG